MKLSAFDCLRRGLANLRANWELVLVRWAGSLLVGLLVVAGLLPPILVLGAGLLSEGFRGLASAGPEAWASVGTRIAERLPTVGLAFALALVGTLFVWLFAGVLYCFLEAGIFGVLTAAERQALPGADRGREWFRTFSLRNFFGWGGRYLWRFFGFVNLWLAVWIGVFLLIVFWFLLIAGGGQRWGRSGALGIGCGGALPVLFLLFVVSFWGLVAQADLAREGSGVWEAAGTGLRVLGARFGAVTLLFLLFFGCLVVLGIAGLVVGLLLGLGLAHTPLAFGLSVRFGLNLLQSLAGSVVAIALAAAMVALVQSEIQRGLQVRSPGSEGSA